MKCLLILCLAVYLTSGAPSTQENIKDEEFWKGTILESTVENLKSNCDNKKDNNIACVQMKAFKFLDKILHGNYNSSKLITDGVSVKKNGYENEIIESQRSSVDDSLINSITNFIKSNDVTFKLPLVGDLSVESRKIDDGEINFKLNFGSEVEERGKKHKLKKVFIPILTLVLLKAITVVPFLLGLLALKAWNGLQLSFISFVIASGLAIFQLCQKLAADPHAPVILDHPPVAQRSIDASGAQDLAYSGYSQ